MNVLLLNGVWTKRRSQTFDGERSLFVYLYCNMLINRCQTLFTKQFTYTCKVDNLAMAVKVRRIVKQEVDVPDLGNRIKQAREASNRPVTQLAKEAGISRNYWYQLEAESVLSGVAEETLRKIEEVLGINLGVQFDD